MNHAANHVLYGMADVEAGDHLCCLYEANGEHGGFLQTFLHQGISRGERTLYIVDAQSPDAVLSSLDGIEGIGGYLARGQLEILTAMDTYIRQGFFDPDDTIAFLRSETERALEEGYSGLRVTTEMTWVLKKVPGSQRLIEFESKLDTFLRESKCTVMCQYDQKQFGPILLLYAMATHPIAAVGAEIYDNFYYMPPPDLLGKRGIPVATLHHWLENLAVWKQAMIAQYA